MPRHLVRLIRYLYFSAEISVLITQIIADFKTCEDLLQNVKLPDVKIGGRTYKGIDQLTLFAEAASYSDSYCGKRNTRHGRHNDVGKSAQYQGIPQAARRCMYISSSSLGNAGVLPGFT